MPAMLTFEEIQPALHKWANYFQNRQFEKWELFNAVWAKGDVQHVKHIKLVSQRVKWDMIDYMRSVTRLREQRRYADRGKQFIKTIPFGQVIPEDSKLDYFDFIAIKPTETPKIETKDFFYWLMKGLTRAQKLFVLLHFVKGFNHREIGKVVGVSESRISQMNMEIIPILKVKLVDNGFEVRKTDRKISVMRSRRKTEYATWYSRTHKKEIKARREQLKLEKLKARKKIA